MHEHSAHADQVYASALEKSAAAISPIVASWRRCMTMHHLAPEDVRAPWRLTDPEYRRAREQSGQLIADASDELDRLFLAVGKAWKRLDDDTRIEQQGGFGRKIERRDAVRGPHRGDFEGLTFSARLSESSPEYWGVVTL